jgi:omega-6 fatty acid desaturase (delta-12 desaturase)
MVVSVTPTEKEVAAQSEASLRLRDILKILPKDVFRKQKSKAWLGVILSVAMVGLGYLGLSLTPWYGLPFLWIFTGTALTGFFVIGHDCGHRSFAQRKWVNDWVGHLMFLPLLYPFHAWRIQHNHHHKHTNKLEEDNAWTPFEVDLYKKSPALLKWLYRGLRGRFWWIGSIAHWAALHFNWSLFKGKEREQVRFSVLLVIGTAILAFPVLLWTVGIWGVVKFWLMPWLGYHFWMSTFTIVHHTAPHIAFRSRDRWQEAEAQLFGSVHCDYPKWVEVLCHDINVHIPHHVSSAIPSYHLRKAHQILQEKWGSQLNETRFSWKLLQEITDYCHLYDPEACYQPFSQVDP